MDKPPDNTRRTLVTLIVVLAVVQIAMLSYLWSLLGPTVPQDAAEPAPLFQWPSASTPTPDTTPQAPAPDAAEIVVGPLVPATNYTDLARTFDEEQALEHLAYLASDELGGRQPGTPGGWTAGDYVAARFAEYGLQPAGVDAAYFQTFTVPYGRITSLPVLTITPPNGKTLVRNYAYRTDYRALTGGYLGAGEGEGPVVWLNQCLHDDYGSLDMVGKIALCRFTGNPEVYRQAIEHRVGGLLLLDRDREDTQFRRGGYRETAWVPQTIPAYVISETVAQDLLIGTDYTLDDLSLRFTATPLSTTVHIVVTIEEQDEAEARNVLALLPGSDPEYSDEVVVIGAHYDHLGREPDGAIINGANDNASGVATILEIARLWQAQGFRPARSVLFAAWDGEEQGLLGSQHYVENPTFPLTRTVATLNLDMVGAGDTLQIDGQGPVAAQLEAGAGVYFITHTLAFVGRSDHVSFYGAGVPAAMLIYWPDVFYHTPNDELNVIEPEKLKAVGVLSAHTLAALAEGHVELERAVERLQASIGAGDREAFLEGLDPTDADPAASSGQALRATWAAWFDSLWSREPTNGRRLSAVTVEPSQMRIGDGEAHVTLQLTYRWANTTQHDPSVSYDARFVQRDGTWAFAGYDLDTLRGDVLTVAHFPSTALGTGPDVPLEASRLLTPTQHTYLTLAADLGLEPITSTRVIYYPDAATMRAIARPAPPPLSPPSQGGDGGGWLVSSAEVAEIAWGQPITPALVNLALNQMGLPSDKGAWLREGLALHYDDSAQRELLPPLVATTDVLTPLLDFPILSDLPDQEAQALRGYAWMATEYLLDQYGSEGLRGLCAAWGRSSDGRSAFQEALSLSPDRFESAWRANRLAPLRADAEDIQSTIATRVEAVVAGSEASFLSTVTLTDPVLRTEERNWFADRAELAVVTYTVTGDLVGWSPARNEATVALSVNSVITGQPPTQASYDARFMREGDRWLYAGLAWNELASEHFMLKYQHHGAAWAQHVLDLAEAAYDQVTADLEMTVQPPVEIKVYDDGPTLHGLISLSLPGPATSWTAQGEAIRLWLQDGDERGIQATIARELTRHVLYSQGLEIAWLREGVAAFETDRLRSLGTHWGAAQHMPIVQDAVRRGEELPLDDLSSFEDLSPDQLELARAQSWSLVSYVVNEYGLPDLRNLIAQSIASNDTDAGLRAALRVDSEPFLAAWQEHARSAGVPNSLVLMAQRFNSERALAHVAVLASPEFGGREAGALGADLTAAYIAEQFAGLGLEPLGDPLWVAAPVTETAAVTATGEHEVHAGKFVPGQALDYLQQFPISYTHLTSIPALILLDDDGATLHEFTYREEFVESVGRGIGLGELVWVHTEDLEGLAFGGAVVLEQGVDDPSARAAQLQDHGAGGLIVATDREAHHFQIGRTRPISGAEIAIPVFEITDAAFKTLLERLEMHQRDLSFAPPVLPLGVQMRQTLARSPLTTTTSTGLSAGLTANVLGLLPGSDPDVADEVLIVGAHYDHVGQSVDGLYFPGANQNASGVGALLEMTRVWQTTGFRPARSVLLVAWGAEELDSAGAAHYLAHPAVPLTRTVGVIALDSIGNGRGYRLLFYGTQENDLPLMYRIETGTAELNRRAQRQFEVGAGWHALFNSACIPTAKLIWDGADRDVYLPSDTVDYIDPERLAFSGEILTLAASWLAGP